MGSESAGESSCSRQTGAEKRQTTRFCSHEENSASVADLPPGVGELSIVTMGKITLVLLVIFVNAATANTRTTNLTAIPLDIPANADRFTLSYSCNIKNVSYLPPLLRLRTLDLNRNSIESFSWMSLCALPNLESLCLMGNQLRYVKLGTVIEHLPKLRKIDLRFNKLASFSEYELGWPQVTKAWINGNPLRCDCDLSWLIVKMVCFQTCEGKDRQTCCSLCSVCYLDRSLEMGTHVCHSPRKINKLHLSNVSAKLTGCGAHQLTTEPEAMPVTSTVFLTDDNENQTETRNQLQNKKTSMSIIPTGSAKTAKTSNPNTMVTTKHEYDDKHSVLYIIITVSCLALTVVLCLIVLNIKYQLSYDWCKGADPSVPVLTIPQIVDHIYDNPEEGFDGGNVAVTSENQCISPTTSHICPNEEDLDGIPGADTNGTENAAATIDHIYCNEEDSDNENDAEIEAPTANQIYSVEEDINNAAETTTNTTNYIYSIEEDVDCETEATAPIRNQIYSIEDLDNKRGAVSNGTKSTASDIYSFEEDFESTAPAPNNIYSTDEGSDGGLGTGTNGTETTVTSITAKHIHSIEEGFSEDHPAVPE
uniref:LRRCT domain-containing protein n=1 Tax=Branchiostoma floridae TaxID=7739 RepID=C3ZTQ2_BRAFL|eukprot:XP_002588039.1 hypothetical protein BRAFLDRAFT_83019 [Branchiostoma floridae]